MSKRDLAIVIVISTFAGIAFGWHCRSVGIDLVRREAVLVGAAHYVADDEGHPRFEWLPRH